ncbi:RNA polymerase sigma factor [Tunturiibacter lichenicola]|uniref:RNA polymerase sigma factor n=1 Tax=Tunturiibacter lichenicola TaxID=2051959 RepID=UPI003D9AD88B
MQATTQQTFLPTFMHYISEQVANEVARSERDTKKTALAAPTAEQRTKTTDATRTLVGQYLKALNDSRPHRMASAHAKAITPWRTYGFTSEESDPDPDTASPLDAVVTSILEKTKDTTERTDEDAEISLTGSDPLPIPRYKRYQRIPNKRKINAAYSAYTQGQNGDGTSDKLHEVISNYAFGVVRQKFNETNYPDGDTDDIAQEVLIDVANALKSFKPKDGNNAMFYAWLNKCVKHAYCRAFNEAKKTSRIETTLIVNVESEDASFEAENPEIYAKELQKQYYLVIPEFIQGIDRQICKWMREGYDYENIARVLETTEQSVRSRMLKIRKKVKELGLKKEFA